ncbi:MAG: helix-turn-helix domain-containing protein [Pseudomonadota bacterium]
MLPNRQGCPNFILNMIAPTRLSLVNDASNEHFKLKYYNPPEGLERYILALFDLQWDEPEMVGRHPGNTGLLHMTIEGEGEFDFGDRLDRTGAQPFIFNAFDVATPYSLKGPWRCLGASLSPFGWAALTQAPVDQYKNRFFPAAELLGQEIETLSDELILQIQRADIGGAEACGAVANWIGERLKPIPSAHERLIEKVLAWLGSSLNPQVDDLCKDLHYSRRQIERLVKCYFGFPPRGLARKFRALRTANLLIQSEITDEGASEIAEAFVDQPHMIRELRRFCGFTPSRLEGNEDTLFLKLTEVKNLNRLAPYKDIGI